MARELRDRLYGAINYYHVWSTPQMPPSPCNRRCREDAKTRSAIRDRIER